MAHRRGIAGEYLQASRADLRPDSGDGAGRDRRPRRGDGPDLLCRGRHRQGPARGSIQDRPAGRCRLLPGLAGGESRFAEALGVPEMAGRLVAKQILTSFQRATRAAFAVIPGSRCAPPGMTKERPAPSGASRNDVREGLPHNHVFGLVVARGRGRLRGRRLAETIPHRPPTGERTLQDAKSITPALLGETEGFWPKGWWSLVDYRIGIVPLPVFVVLLAVIGGFALTGKVPSDILMAIVILSMGGFACAELGKRIPIIRNIGAAAIFATF